MSFRVLHVLDHSWPVLDGYSQRSRSLIVCQLQLGFHPSVVTSPLHNVDDPKARDTELDGVRYLRTSDGTGVLWRAIHGRWPLLREAAVVRLLRSRIEFILSAQTFDLVHAHSPALCGLAASIAARSRHLPFVYEIRAFWEDAAVNRSKVGRNSIRYRIARALETRVVSRADAVVGISRPILEDLKRRGVPPSKLFHVPNGVDALRFQPYSRDVALAGQLGVANLPILGFLGTMFPWEGVPWLVRAAAELHRRGTQFGLLIVGDGAEASHVRDAIRENRAEQYVLFVGRVPNDQVASYYSLMDVLVYPRLSVRLTELVTPLKPLEAMALGKAILGSSVGGLRELIEPDVTGVLFEPGDIEDFCRQAARLLREEDLRRTLGERARQKVSIERDWTAIARGYESVYETAVRNAALR